MNHGITINTSQMTQGMMDEDISEGSSSESGFDTTDLLSGSVSDEVTAQLAAAGPVGIAAAAAIATGKRKGHPHHFETNPSRRKRQQTRLLRKLKATIEEYTTRVGQQAIVMCCTPGKPTQSGHAFKVFGSQPLENVIRNCRSMIMQELENALMDQSPPNNGSGAHLHELPSLIIDGIPTPVDKMTQAQLRNFIPEMLKYSTGRSKPGWGKPECRPVWWPADLPWANVRSDARSEDDKKRVSWTDALRAIVRNCYKHHGRDDLLHVFCEDNHSVTNLGSGVAYPATCTINNPDGSVSVIHIDTGANGNSVVTLPDGSQATVVHALGSLPSQGSAYCPQEASQAVATLAEVASGQAEAGPLGNVGVDIGDNAPQMTISTGPQGQIILHGTDALSGLVTIPASMYQTIATSLAPMGDNSAGTVQVAMAPITQFKTEVPDATQAVEVTSIDPSGQS